MLYEVITEFDNGTFFGAEAEELVVVFSPHALPKLVNFRGRKNFRRLFGRRPGFGNFRFEINHFHEVIEVLHEVFVIRRRI